MNQAPTLNPTTKTEVARPALAEAVHDDLMVAADQLSAAIGKLARVGDHSGGINGLGSRCRGAVSTLTQQRDALRSAADEYRESLSAVRTTQITEHVDEDVLERVRAAKAGAERAEAS